MKSDGYPDSTRVDKVRTQFGRSAGAYATSEVHAKGESLGLLLTLLQPQGGSALDIATGAGHTAIALASHVDRVVATDVTPEMLATTASLAAAEGLGNVETAPAQAEALPFEDCSFDLVTCRLAFHHFDDQAKSAREMMRVLKPGGRLGFTDNVTVTDPDAAEYYNRYEVLRDPSHNCVLPLSQLIDCIESAGLVVESVRRLSKEFEFHRWADRQQVSDPDKERLLEMMRAIPAPLLPLFAPRWADGTMYFSLWEAVLVARKPPLLESR